VATPQRSRTTDAREGLAWAGENIALLVLLPLGIILLWVAIWRVWLPQPTPSPTVVRTVTTTAKGATPGRTVKTVVKSTSASVPSRRSETLEIALLLLGGACVLVAVFHKRIGSIELGKDGLKITLTKAEQAGLGELVSTLHAGGADAETLGAGVRRYVDAVAAHHALAPKPSRAARSVAPEHTERLARAGVVDGTSGLTPEQASNLAGVIAEELL
jgi:hypothetical protein